MKSATKSFCEALDSHASDLGKTYSAKYSSKKPSDDDVKKRLERSTALLADVTKHQALMSKL